ncbi:hypothetical protein [Chryseobacterium lactis]|uniref:hypothetical protein n=1 Tax=Chryseobacterium lactis TaxID=1241981 RepID=UPI0016272DF9|nr:hypothetical protein [Chryseobacterium lactis]
MRLKIDKEKAKSWLRNSVGILNKPYKPVKEKPIAVLTTTGVLYTLGAFYLWSFFGEYNIDYFLYFDLKDSIFVLYEKMMLIVFISIILAPVLLILLSTFLVPNYKSNNKNNYYKYTYNYNNYNSIKDIEKNKFSNLSIFVILACLLGGVWIFLSLFEFSPKYAICFLILAAGSAYVYLYRSVNLGLLLLLALTFLLVFGLGRIDAQHNMKSKNKRKINIVLKNHSDLPILTENDRCKYLINKTSNYYFIKDECRHLILTYSISTGEMTSFTSE